jgi:hypothetical protein
MSFTTWTDTCSRCDGTRFWPSKSGYLVCYTCHPNALDALIVLARRGSVGAIRRAEGWAQAMSSASTNYMEAADSIDIFEQNR